MIRVCETWKLALMLVRLVKWCMSSQWPEIIPSHLSITSKYQVTYSNTALGTNIHRSFSQHIPRCLSMLYIGCMIDLKTCVSGLLDCGIFCLFGRWFLSRLRSAWPRSCLLDSRGIPNNCVHNGACAQAVDHRHGWRRQCSNHDEVSQQHLVDYWHQPTCLLWLRSEMWGKQFRMNLKCRWQKYSMRHLDYTM